jgi:hypothetical protein
MMGIRKKGQVTIFIILGLIVLLSIALFIYFKTSFIVTEPRLLAKELSPISVYVEQCMDKSAEEAVRKISERGGYFTLPAFIESNPSMYVNPDGIGVIKIPFWFYKGARFNPSIVTIQNEIARYVETNVMSCINGFAPFEKEYKITALDTIKVTALLNSDDISFVMKYPIRVNHKGNSTYTIIDKFTTSVPVRLKKIIETANRILESEVRTAYLENFTIDMMTSNPDIPFTDMQFGCKAKEWRVTDIKAKVQEIVSYNIQRIRLKNTNYLQFIEPEAKYKALLKYHMEDIANGNVPKEIPEDAYEYLHMFWDAGLEKDNFINVKISTPPNLDMDFIARPHDNGILRSKVVEGEKKYIKFLCTNMWHFTYDVNYPVIVAIKDEISFGGEGYVFKFAMPVTIHNNEAYKKNYGYQMFMTDYYDRAFCDERSGETTDIRVLSKEDGYSNMPVKGVNLSMQCFTYYCPLGLTQPDDGEYRLRTMLPNCVNPFIVAEKEGYLTARKQLTGTRLDIPMTKLKKMDYKVVFHRYNSIGKVLEAKDTLEEDMNASLQITTDDYTQYKMYPIEDDMSDESKTISLVDGDATYTIELILTQEGEYVGGYNGEVTLSSVDIANADTIVFHAIKYVPIPYTKDEKLLMMDYLLNGNYKEVLKPKLVAES